MNRIPLLLIAILSLGMTCCSEFIEYPLENEEIELLAPYDGLVSQDTVITFWWSMHEDAHFYRLQVVRPDFRQTQSILIDTLVDGDKISYELEEGTYSWRVRPENHGSAGEYRSRSFEIKK